MKGRCTDHWGSKEGLNPKGPGMKGQGTGDRRIWQKDGLSDQAANFYFSQACYIVVRAEKLGKVGNRGVGGGKIFAWCSSLYVTEG